MGIRAEEHEIISREASNQAKLDMLMVIRDEFINHVRDGHPRRIEDMLGLRMQIFDEHTTDIDRRLMQIQQNYAREMEHSERRLKTLEDNRINEHSNKHGK